MLSDKLFINNPINIRKEMLNPTDNTNFSVESILSNFRTCRINNPGRIVRKRNPMICLKNGMFKRMAKSVRISITITNTNRSLYPNFNSIFSSLLKCYFMCLRLADHLSHNRYRFSLIYCTFQVSP